MGTRVIASALAGTVTNFLMGWIIWGMLLMNFMKENSDIASYPGLMKPDNPPEMMSMVYMLIGGFFFCWLLAWMWDKYMHHTSFVSGAKTGALIGLCIALMYDMMFMAMMNLYHGSAMTADIVGNTICVAIVGGVIAMVQGKMGAKA